MPRKARDERLDTRTARLKLATRREPYWRSIQEGRAIGYRRLGGQKAGAWIARHYDPATGRRYQAIGFADDYLDADGVDSLTFGQAQDRAREWFTALGKQDGKAVDAVTVRSAIEHYLADYTARGGKARRSVEITIEAHILPQLGDKLISALTPQILRSWHRALATAPRRLRTAKGAPTRSVKSTPDSDIDAARARRATANRVLTVLKAALNLAFREGHAVAADPWMKVKPFPKVDAPRVRYLTDTETSRLVNACPADLRKLVTAALLTGCRYGELTTLRGADVDLAAGVLSIQASKSGTARHVVLTDEAQTFFKDHMAGQDRSKPFLRRADGETWGRSHQFRPLREACAAAKISPPISFHILRHTHASRLAMKGVPMAVIAAQLGHSDIKLTQRHYAHLSPGYVADTIRAAFGTLGVKSETNITPMRQSSG